jgi:hypothetical protein
MLAEYCCTNAVVICDDIFVSPLLLLTLYNQKSYPSVLIGVSCI